jgi:hypothetical protein
VTVREFDGVDDEIIFSIGALSNTTYGTVAFLVKRLSEGTGHVLFGLSTSSGDQFQRLVIEWTPFQDLLYGTTNGAVVGGHGSSGVWRLIVARKASGTVQPRFSVYNYSTSTWSHANGNTAIENAVAPGAGGFVRFKGQFGSPQPHLRLAVRAVWPNAVPWSADAAGDSAIVASGLHTSLQDWLDSGPGALWSFDQSSVLTPVEDLTEGGSDQTSRTGTSVVTDDDPPGFDFSTSTGVTGALSVVLPTPVSSLSAVVSNSGALAVQLPTPVVTLAAHIITLAEGYLSGTFPLPVVSLSASASIALVGLWPDAELVMLDMLSPLITTATVTHTDEDLAPPAIQVQRTGGTDDGVTDRPTVQITCYGTTRAQAWELNNAVQELVLSKSGGGVVSGEFVIDVLIDHTRTLVAGRQLPYANPNIKSVISEYRMDMRQQF